MKITATRDQRETLLAFLRQTVRVDGRVGAVAVEVTRWCASGFDEAELTGGAIELLALADKQQKSFEQAAILEPLFAQVRQ
jgi:hypothetical protein